MPINFKLKSIKNIFKPVKKKIDGYLSGRPHRSLRMTRRRDYIKNLNLPGYWSFTNFVNKTLYKNRKVFLYLVLTYAILTIVMVGMASQDAYSNLVETLKSTSNGILDGNFGTIGKASLLLLATINGDISANLTETQQIYAVLIAIMAWMTTVWLLRNIMAGYTVKLRDGLYNSGAPLLSTFLVSMLLIVQLIPMALAFVGYSAATTTGLIAGGGVEAMLFWIVAGLLVVMSLYFITSTFFAMIIVTIPGMYPYQAIKTAGDIVLGRRLRILYRLIWMAMCIGVFWIFVMVPTILFDLWIKSSFASINWLPIIPIVFLIVSSISIIWGSSYIYLLYRKVVDNDDK